MRVNVGGPVGPERDYLMNIKSAYIDALLIFHHVFGQQSDGTNGGSRNESNQSTINRGNFNHRRNAQQISRDLNKQKGYNAWI